VRELLHIIELLILPPASGLLLVLAGFLLWRWRPARLLILAGLAWIYVAATPLFAGWLLSGLESGYEIAGPVPESAGAILVLAGGRYLYAPEYGGETVNAYSLERLRYAARVHRDTGLPLLVSGGRVRGDEPASEADLLAGVLEEEMGLAVRWRESESRNTCENATYSAHLLKAEGIGHALLVSHALHMPRALWCFQRTGLVVTPYPTRRISTDSSAVTLTDFLPQSRALWYTGRALHEYLGLLWYRLSV